MVTVCMAWLYVEESTTSGGLSLVAGGDRGPTRGQSLVDGGDRGPTRGWSLVVRGDRGPNLPILLQRASEDREIERCHVSNFTYSYLLYECKHSD